MSTSGGKILCEQAYAQGKMLVSSDWNGRLPRGSTPSDVDLYFDNLGDLLVCEFSGHNSYFTELETGQFLGYKAYAQKGCVACLCRHSVPPDTAINTYRDVDTFSVMFTRNGQLIETIRPYSGKHWPRFVDKWYENSSGLMEKVATVCEPVKYPPEKW